MVPYIRMVSYSLLELVLVLQVLIHSQVTLIKELVLDSLILILLEVVLQSLDMEARSLLISVNSPLLLVH